MILAVVKNQNKNFVIKTIIQAAITGDISDLSRLKIVKMLLHKPLCVCEIQKEVKKYLCIILKFHRTLLCPLI